MITASYPVVGMTCEHCARSVSDELGAVSGVQDVAVDLPTGLVTVTSDAALAAVDVQAAVEEAGYELAGSPELAPGP